MINGLIVVFVSYAILTFGVLFEINKKLDEIFFRLKVLDKKINKLIYESEVSADDKR